MHRPSMGDEVDPCPGISREEFRRQHVPLQPIASPAREHHVARHVRAAVRERMHVVERGVIEIERRGAVHTSAAAVTHGGSLDRSFLMSGRNVLSPAGRPREAGKGDVLNVPTS